LQLGVKGPRNEIKAEYNAAVLIASIIGIQWVSWGMRMTSVWEQNN